MNVLIVDDEPSLRFALSELLSGEKYSVFTAASGEETISILENQNIDIAILDYHLPGINGVELLTLIKQNYKWIQVILITAYGSETVAINAIKNGAYDYITKPFDNETLLNRLSHIRESITTKKNENEAAFGSYFSPIMISLIEKVKAVASADIPILITGESGSGKELIAKNCHYHSGRNGKFVSINCSAIPASLIESELFGSEKGAYTGAISRKTGLFELADNGTIFLDEIGETPLDIQAKLLRVLQEGEIVRVGGGLPIKINSRVVAATNRDLPTEIKNGNFREDLFYRLNVIEINVPPLRKRKEEIKPLATMFLNEFNNKYKKEILGFEEDAMESALNYSWRGNIRELKNRIEQATILCGKQWITALDMQISNEISNNNSFGASDNKTEKSDKKSEEVLDNDKTILERKNIFDFQNLPTNLVAAKKDISLVFEKEFILYYLNKNGWNVKATSDEIGLCRQDLYKKMKSLGIQKEIKYY
ncbi:MAG TPA: sigma-54 dependent transcriptional regulator [Spirochaetota bacterium]|nr:sigma-54 dependent transcriptional regulator [Spirochaetota bacterium]